MSAIRNGERCIKRRVWVELSLSTRRQATTAICALRPSRVAASDHYNPPFAMFRRCLDQCPLRAESALTRAASRRTGMRAKAAVPLRARNGLRRAEQVAVEGAVERREGGKEDLPGCAGMNNRRRSISLGSSNGDLLAIVAFTAAAPTSRNSISRRSLKARTSRKCNLRGPQRPANSSDRRGGFRFHYT